MSPTANNFFLSWDFEVLEHRGAARGQHPNITLALRLAACEVPPATGDLGRAVPSASRQPIWPVQGFWEGGEHLVLRVSSGRCSAGCSEFSPFQHLQTPRSLSSEEIPAQNLLCSKTQRFLLAPAQGL